MIEDRRQFQRVGLDSPVSIFLDKRVSGSVLDLSEQGLAVYGPASWRQGDVLPFAFELPEGGGQIYGRAKIVWKDESVYRMGLHFLELADRSREQLMQWVSARVYTMWPSDSDSVEHQPMVATQAALPLAGSVFQDSRDIGEADPEPAVAPHLPDSEFEPVNFSLAPPETFSRWDPASRAIGLVFGALLLLVICGYGVRYFRGTRNTPRVAAATADAKTDTNATAVANSVANSAANTSTSAPVIQAEPAPHASEPAAISSQATRIEVPGFILQVGAMTHQGNADALAENLQKNKFPAFVFHRGSDPFYRVAVGPFSDKQSPVKTKGELEKRGLKPFLRAWAPE